MGNCMSNKHEDVNIDTQTNKGSLKMKNTQRAASSVTNGKQITKTIMTYNSVPNIKHSIPINKRESTKNKQINSGTETSTFDTFFFGSIYNTQGSNEPDTSSHYDDSSCHRGSSHRHDHNHHNHHHDNCDRTTGFNEIHDTDHHHGTDYHSSNTNWNEDTTTTATDSNTSNDNNQNSSCD